MNSVLKYLYLTIGVIVLACYAYSSYYGKAIWEGQVKRNTEYTGKRFYGGYGNRLNHK
ncbi:hypothetical protein ABIE26_004321 [Pedobacter africanus]|uniref:Uncharacterized protein n=1 Tax=Pedobacter africanus TaxID=151894 RepID=A0ACC6L2P0_9SPHI|nr:hypothetical protein [Pedobacter africanus]MDR6785611.1 hypothetical protein [Pedobacter africanus]